MALAGSYDKMHYGTGDWFPVTGYRTYKYPFPGGINTKNHKISTLLYAL